MYLTKLFLKIIFIFILVMVFSVFKNSNLIANKNHAIPLNSSQFPWRSIGIIKYNNKKCVAIVIDKNILLTSAYCLFDENGNKISNTQNISFNAGYKDRFYLSQATITSYLTPNISYPPNNILDIKNSWALLFTNEDISNITGIIKIYNDPITSEYLKNHKIITVGYTEKQEDGLFASIKCTFNSSGIEFNNKSFVDTEAAPILLQSCNDNFFPLLGSPVLSIDKDNNVSVIGIVSGKLTNNTKDNTKEHINIILPMTALNSNYNQLPAKSSEEEYNNKDLERILKK